MNKIAKRIIGFVLVMSLLLQSLFMNQFGIGYVNAAGDSYDFTEEVSVDTLTNDIDDTTSKDDSDLDDSDDDYQVADEIIYSDSLDNLMNGVYEGDLIIDKNFQLSGDMEVSGELVIINGTVRLNGHKLTVEKNVILSGGTLDIDSGELIVNGDFYQAVRTVKEVNDQQTLTDEDDVNPYEYSDTDATINMAQDADRLTVNGSFLAYPNEKECFNIQNGLLTIGGDFVYRQYGTARNIPELGSSVSLFFSEDKKHNISVKNSYGFSTYLYSPNITVGENSELSGDDIFAKNIVADNGKVLNNIFGDNLKLSGGTYYGSFSIEKSIITEGYVTVENSISTKFTVESGTLIVNGNIDSASVSVPKDASLICNGNVSISSISTIDRLVLNGNKKQTLTLSRSTVGTLEILNKSKDGVYSESMLTYTTLVPEDANISYGFGIPRTGFTLSDDQVFDGNFVLTGGVLDLAGHTFTVKGDFVFAKGTVNINDGKLIVEGDFKEQYPKDAASVSLGQGLLCMYSDGDVVEVNGDYFCDGNTHAYMRKGRIRVKGSILSELYHSVSDINSDIELFGQGNKTVTCLKEVVNLNIDTTSKIIFTSQPVIKGKITSNTRKVEGAVKVYNLSSLPDYYYGDVILIGSGKTEVSRDIRGRLTTYGDLSFSDVLVEADDIEVRGYIIMDGDKAYLHARNSLLIESGKTTYSQSDGSKLLNGAIEVNGSFSYLKADNMAMGDDIRFTLTPRDEESDDVIEISGPSYVGSSFAKIPELVLRGEEKNFHFNLNGEDIAENIVYDFPRLEAVEGIEVAEVTCTSVKLKYVDNNTYPKAAGYIIKRDGNKVATLSSTEYTDLDVEPDTKYSYTVTAIDRHGNESPESDELEVATPADNEAPAAPKNLSVINSTATTITISWDKSRDNVAVAGYNIYRNGELIKEIFAKENEYVDDGIQGRGMYDYCVTAVDTSGNESEKSNIATGATIYLQITGLMPTDGVRIGDGETELKVQYGTLPEDSFGRILVECQVDNSALWYTICDTEAGYSGVIKYLNRKLDNDISESCFTWHTAGFEGEINVKVTLFDRNGNSGDSYNCTYYLDHTSPDSVEKLAVKDNNGVAELSWEMSDDPDVVLYNIYRYDETVGMNGSSGTYDLEATEGQGSSIGYKKIGSVPDKMTENYFDRETVLGHSYKYKVTAVDNVGNESPLDNPVTITMGKDGVAPKMLSFQPLTGRINAEASFKVTASDNKDVTSVRFYIRQNDEDKWKYVGETDKVITLADEASEGYGNDTDKVFSAAYGFDTTAYPDGEYKLKAAAVDSSGNESTDDIERRFVIDNTGIKKIEVTKSNTGDTYVQLFWEDVTEEDFDHFLVEMKEDDGIGDSAQYHEAGISKDILGMTIDNLKTETSYTFRVCGVDDLGNKGEYSDEIHLITVNDTSAPVITAVYPTEERHSEVIQLSMHVEDNDCIDHVRWSYSFDNKEFKDIASVEAEQRRRVYINMILI